MADEQPQTVTPLELNYATPQAPTRKPFHLSIPVRVGLVVFGVIAPAAGLGISVNDYFLSVDWQNGEPLAVLTLIPHGAASVWFLPLLMAGWAALIFHAAKPEIAADQPLVQLGLTTGVITGLQYTFLTAFAGGGGHPTRWLGTFPWLMLGGLIGVGVLVLVWIAGRIKVHSWWAFATAAGVLALILVVILVFIPAVGFVPIALMLLGAAPLATAAFSLALWFGTRIRRAAPEPVGLRLPWWLALVGVGWLGAYAASWLAAYNAATRLYAKLPTEAPSCYVVTAASRGRLSPRFGHRQLRRIKTLELFVADVAPHHHRLLRRIYDTVGPSIARLVGRHRLLADAAYLSLLPVELFCKCVGAAAYHRVCR